ncbi:growth factor receptor domain-containing protein, partial [Fistulina hepatica ATCC 64428]
STNSSLDIICVPGTCLEGSTSLTLGTVLSDGTDTSIHLLPGTYTSSTNPELLHNELTSSSAKLTPSAGFANSSSSTDLPLTIALSTGFAIYSESLYAGSVDFKALPSTPYAVNTSISLAAQSFAVSSSVWLAISAGTSDRLIVWESIPDVSQLPSGLDSNFTLIDMESSACSPACSSAGICNTNGTCSCAAGFTGSSCQSCESNHYGQSCLACPTDCSDCDDGITGTGRCLQYNVTDLPSSCDCVNGECQSDGSCTCLPGWKAASNGTSCATCEEGYYLTTTGDCSVCNLGCETCADSTGKCAKCEDGWTMDSSDETECDANEQTNSDGSVCPDGSYDKNGTCTDCDSACSTCTGGTAKDCSLCTSGTYMYNGTCVSASDTGVCEGTTMIADNNKHECDSCGWKCEACEISNFTTASVVDQAVCTSCLPGYYIYDDACVSECPSGTFVSSKDNQTCADCDSSCSTCAGSASFCLTCSSSKYAHNGTCVSSCPTGTFKSGSSCLNCHPDCDTCSGSSFNQCSTCKSDRPVLNNGRCLPTCSQSQYYDEAAGSCESCDSSCSSCSGSESNECLACTSSTQVLRSGSCVAANCNETSNVIAGLGVCLESLFTYVDKSSTKGIDTPTTSRSLAWWEILLMALGCAFIFMCVLWCWRRHARKQRAKRTRMFASAKDLDKPTWHERLARFRARLFGGGRRVQLQSSEEMGMGHVVAVDRKEPSVFRSAAPSSRWDESQLIDSYKYARTVRSEPNLECARSNRMSGPSMYSQVTGNARRVPDVRQPVKADLLAPSTSSRDSGGSWLFTSASQPQLRQTEAQEYANWVKPALRVPSPLPGNLWMQPIQPTRTGASSNNPFRNM